MGHRFVDIDETDDPREFVNFLSPQALGVTTAVITFVNLNDHLGDPIESLTEGAHDSLRVLRMFAQLAELFGRKPVDIQHFFRNTQH